MLENDEENYLAKFDPYRDSSGWVTERPEDYAFRMQSSSLPRWPKEVLIEWLYRHAKFIYDYAFLGYENFLFERKTWPLAEIPGREAFADPGFCDDSANIADRARNKEWLAKYMLENGTWNTPVILLETPREKITAPGGWELRSPLHLIEGHRRLSFLVALRELGKAREQHDVWIVKLETAHLYLNKDT